MTLAGCDGAQKLAQSGGGEKILELVLVFK